MLFQPGIITILFDTLLAGERSLARNYKGDIFRFALLRDSIGTQLLDTG